MNASEYRQLVADFRNRLNNLAVHGHHDPNQRAGRVFVNETGHRTRFTPSRSDTERLAIYGRRRYNSVARVLVLFEILRDHRRHDQAYGQTLAVSSSGAFWQAFRFTTDRPACHTCPSLLLINGDYPTHASLNMGLSRHIVVVFSDCMVMPVIYNRIDRYFDDDHANPAFVAAASQVLNNGMPWRQALDMYTTRLRDLFGDMISILDRDYRCGDEELQAQLEACQAYYEGLFLTRINDNEIRNYVGEVRAEMAIP